MHPDAIINALGAFTALTSIGIFVLVGMKMRFNHKLRLREMPPGENEHLTDAVGRG